MSEPVLHPAAKAMLATASVWTLAELAAAMAGQSEGIAADLAACAKASWRIDAERPVAADVLLAAAVREADHLGNYYTRCEHLLLAVPRVLAADRVPGTGKSTLAQALGSQLRAPVFSMDWQLGALVPFGVLRPDNLEPLSELMLAAAMAAQLQLGLDVIVDAIMLRIEERQRLREIAEVIGAAFVGVEFRCSDEQVQRARVEGRERGIPG